jgi:GTPase SAR1 family protein
MKSLTLVKIIMLGEIGVGTHRIQKNWCAKSTNNSYSLSVGVDIGIGRVQIGSKILGLQLWNLSTEDPFKKLRQIFIEGSWGAVIVFDVNKPSSISKALKWVREIWAYNGKGLIPIIVVGNKNDLMYHHGKGISRKISKKLVDKLSSITSLYDFECPYVEICAKNSLEVRDVFRFLTLNIIKYMTSLKNERNLTLIKVASQNPFLVKEIDYVIAK